MSADDSDPAYVVAPVEDGFAVVNNADRVIVVCADEGSAGQYAVLMNEAYRVGFKAGFRAARRRS